MAFTINGSLAIDETTGTQNAADLADSTGNDVADGLGSLATYVPQFDALLSVTVPAGTVPINVAVSNGNADNATGTALLTGFGADVVDLAFTNSTGGPLAGEYAKFGAGVGDFLLTTQGRKICLYSYVGDDLSGVDENNVVFGRQANADGTPDAGGAIVFAAYLQPTNSSGAALASDVDAYGAKVWLVEYEPLQHGITGTTFAAHDDARTLTDPLYVTVGTRAEFSLEGAPSGQNLFLAFGDGTPTTTDVTIVVTAHNAANQSGADPVSTADDISITTGGTVNTGQGGGGTTLGHTNQMVDPGEGLYFTFVTGALPGLTVPNLDQNEADLETNIQFSNVFNSYGASFAVVQTQGDSQATVKLTAMTTAAETGAAFLDGVGVANGDAPVGINWIKVNTFTKSGNKLVPEAEHVFTPPGGFNAATGVTATFNANGTVELTGVQANDVISYRTGDAGGALPHQRVLIENTGNPIPNASSTNASFDIGKFSLINANTDTDAFQALSFQDDGPSIDVSATAVPLLTTDDTDIPDTAGPSDFSVLFTTADFGQDGFKDSDDNDVADADALAYTLGVSAAGAYSGLMDTLSGDKIYLYLESGQVKGRVGLDDDGGADPAGAVAFTISVNAGTGAVSMVQSRAVVHDDPADPDEAGASAAGLAAASLVTLTATIIDGDGDSDSATRDIGAAFAFEDDGPSIDVSATAVPLLTTDDTDIPDTAGPSDFSVLFTTADFGQDGFKDADDDDVADADALAYTLGVSAAGGVDSGLVDSQSGRKIFLFLQGGVVNGRVGNASNLADAAGAIAITISVDAGTGAVSLAQNRAIMHDDPLDPVESGVSAATMAASLVTLTATATDGDGDTDTATRNIGDAFRFEDDGPALAVGNLVGTGTTLPQIGYWAGGFGQDGAGATGLDIALTGFTLVRPDSSTTSGTFAFSELAGSPNGSGAYLFGGTLTGDFDNNAATANTSVDFTLTAYANGSYALDLVQGFSSSVTTSTAGGGLGAGGPDPVQTLYIPPPPATPTETVVFFSAKPLASDADLLSGIGLGAPDPTEAQLQTGSLPDYIDPRSMNVSTSGIGVGNNLLQGYGTSALEAIDESFVVNPLSLVSSVEVFVDNSVSGYSYSGGERMYYTVFYDDGTFLGDVPVTTNLGLPNKGQPISFVISGGGKMIDAVQLTMAIGEVKIPEIRFTTQTENLANDVKLDFLATVTDKDGDTATSAFSADLFANEIAGLFDFVLAGTASAQDAFNIDLATSKNKYQVTGFDTGTDKLVLIGDATAVVTNIDNSGADSIVTITETGAQVTMVTVVGVDLLGSHVAFG